LGKVAAAQGDYVDARARLTDALAIARELDDSNLRVETIDYVATLLGSLGRHQDAAQLVAWTDETFRQSGFVRDKADQESADKIIADARGVIGDDVVEHARSSGAALSVAEALEVAEDRLKTVTG